MEPLILGATRSSWLIATHHGTELDKSPQMAEARRKALERDRNTCRYCGFTAAKWQEVHHINDDHNDHSLSNLATACCFCHQCFHLGIAGSANGGMLIWLPELSQAQLHHVCRALFVALSDETSPMVGAAQMIISTLESRAQFLEQQFSPEASDASFMGQVLLSMKGDYAKREGFFKNIRLLPKEGRFRAQAKYWAETVFRDLPAESWSRLLDDPTRFAGR